MLIRRGKPDDAPVISALEKRVLGETLGEKHLQYEMSQPVCYYLVCFLEEKLIGYIGSIQNDDNLMIQNFVVDTIHQRKKIGTTLLNWLFALVTPKSAILEVRSKNQIAIEFYEKSGFIYQRTHENYYGDDDALVYIKEFYK